MRKNVLKLFENFLNVYRLSFIVKRFIKRTVYFMDRDRLPLLPKFIHNFRKYGLNGGINRPLHNGSSTVGRKWRPMRSRQPYEIVRTRG